MNFPERIFAIGGAGKAIALELLESDWVVSEILRPRPTPESVTVTIIDTAEGERNTDKQRIQAIRERLAERERELRDSEQGRTGTISVEYKLITGDLHLSGAIDLLGEEAVPRITAGNGMDEDDWWLEDQHINENLDFAKGVVRKRGLGKALYYKAYAEDDELSSYIDLPQKGQVAMLVGLGGGTGSGIAIDIARHLQDKQPTAEVTLFGVLPNHTEGRRESTNAFAALSELEYNTLHGEDCFTDRVVVPIGPTNFDGKTSNRIQTDRLLEEFDEAMLYLLVAYYNTEGLEDPFAGTPQYAPFTVGVPQVLRYNVEAIREAREQFRDLLQSRADALEHEAEVYARVEQFLSEHGTDAESELRDIDRTDLDERIDGIESLLDVDLFTELEYRSVELFGDILRGGRENGAGVAEQVSVVAKSLEAADTTGRGEFVDDIDELLAEVLEANIALADRRRRLLERRQGVDDSRLRDAVEFLLDIGDASEGPGVTLQRLEQRLADLRDQRDRREAELDETRAELERKRREQTEAVERQTDELLAEIEPELERLGQMDTEAMRSALMGLDEVLDRFVHEIVNTVTHEEVDRVPTDDVLDRVAELRELLGPVDVGFDPDEVAESVTELKKAKRAFVTVHQQKTTVEQLTPWKSDTEAVREEARRDYRIQKSQLNERGVFQVGQPEGEFTVTITHDGGPVFAEYRRQRQARADAVVDTLADQLDETRLQRVEAELDATEPDPETIREILAGALRESADDLEDLAAETADLEETVADLDRRCEACQAMLETFQRANNRRERWLEADRAFRERFEAHGTERGVSTDDSDYVYVKTMQPEDIFLATGSSDLAGSDLLDSETERRRVRSGLEELARNAQAQQYTGLHRRKIARDRSRYSGLRIRVAAMSPAVDRVDPETLDFQRRFEEAFDLGASGKRVESPFASWRTRAGGPWDIALSVFVTGVFLDNIRKAVQADGYQTGYRERAERLGDDIYIHHSDGLEDGRYVRRSDTLNLEGDGAEFYLGDEDRIVEELLAEYIETREI